MDSVFFTFLLFNCSVHLHLSVTLCNVSGNTKIFIYLDVQKQLKILVIILSSDYVIKNARPYHIGIIFQLTPSGAGEVVTRLEVEEVVIRLEVVVTRIPTHNKVRNATTECTVEFSPPHNPTRRRCSNILII